MQSWRINLILIVFLICGSAILAKLFYIQVIRADYYKALAQGMFNIEEQVAGERGEVYFRGGEPLAINMDWPLVFASPSEIIDKQFSAEKLAEALSLDKEALSEKLEKESIYELIKKRITEQESQNIKDLDLKGIYLGKEKGRYYPQEAFASQLIGFLDNNMEGQYGIEGYYNNDLKGKRSQKGKDLVLTIDYFIQFKAEELLSKAKEDLDIEEGEIIVIDPNNGEILALANFPNFNPNQYFAVSDFSVFKNKTTQEIFEPGSVFKPITVASALEEGKITPETTYVDTGSVKIGGYTIYNYGNRIWGEQSMIQVLEKSINTGAVFAQNKLGNNSFLKYIEKFSFFKPTGIDLDEVYSENKEFKKGYEINFATASFGQGIEITPVQLVKAYTAIANEGKMVKPFIVKEIVDKDMVLKTQPVILEEPVISAKTANQVSAMMVSVIENGYSKSAGIPGYYVAGKTGTAQVSYAALGVKKSGYSDKTWQSFIGFAPAFDPKFIILVKLDNPKTKTAEYSAAPIFQALAKSILDYYQIPSDHE